MSAGHGRVRHRGARGRPALPSPIRERAFAVDTAPARRTGGASRRGVVVGAALSPRYPGASSRTTTGLFPSSRTVRNRRYERGTGHAGGRRGATSARAEPRGDAQPADELEPVHGDPGERLGDPDAALEPTATRRRTNRSRPTATRRSKPGTSGRPSRTSWRRSRRGCTSPPPTSGAGSRG
jgi:hypothetical protein